MSDETPVLNPTQWTVNLWQGDDLFRIQEAEQAVAAAMPTNSLGVPIRLGDTSALTEAVAYRDQLRDEAEPRAIKATVQRLPRKQFRDLIKAHPPREGDEADKEIGFNEEAVADELVPACLVAPEFKSPAFREEFLDNLSDAQFGLLFDAAYAVNRGGVPDPKADMSSRVSQIYGETSTSPERLGG